MKLKISAFTFAISRRIGLNCWGNQLDRAFPTSFRYVQPPTDFAERFPKRFCSRKISDD
jgi:hypothetical protein